MNDAELVVSNDWLTKLNEERAVEQAMHELNEAHRAEMQSVLNSVQRIMELSQDLTQYFIESKDEYTRTWIGGCESDDEYAEIEKQLAMSREILGNAIHILKAHS